ncbi:hypothetical protein JCM16303_001827 [Sporobolomyces ruberrimus]
MSAPRFAPRVKSAPSVAGITPQFTARLIPNLALWGGAGLGALFVFGAGIPLFRQDVFYRLGHSEKRDLLTIFSLFRSFLLPPTLSLPGFSRTPDSDKPF